MVCKLSPVGGIRMNDSSPDERSNFAKGFDLATRISTACLTMVLPALLGHYVDQRLGTKFLFILVGLALGMALGIFQLIRLVKSLDDSKQSKQD